MGFSSMTQQQKLKIYKIRKTKKRLIEGLIMLPALLLVAIFSFFLTDSIYELTGLSENPVVHLIAMVISFIFYIILSIVIITGLILFNEYFFELRKLKVEAFKLGITPEQLKHLMEKKE